MTTIKGPFTISGGIKNVGDLVSKAKEIAGIDDSTPKTLPFEATGWQSTKMPENADMTGIKLAGEKLVKEKPVKKQVKKKSVLTKVVEKVTKKKSKK